jgi:hypothetical protein
MQKWHGARGISLVIIGAATRLRGRPGVYGRSGKDIGRARNAEWEKEHRGQTAAISEEAHGTDEENVDP